MATKLSGQFNEVMKRKPERDEPEYKELPGATEKVVEVINTLQEKLTQKRRTIRHNRKGTKSANFSVTWTGVRFGAVEIGILNDLISDMNNNDISFAIHRTPIGEWILNVSIYLEPQKF